jgi:DNA-binding MarR family transcriptional regulator
MYTMVYDDRMTSQHDDQLSFETGTGYLLARLGSLAERSWIGMLRRHNLTPTQHAVLLALRERGPLGQQALSHLIAVDPRNVVPILDGLVDQHLIDRHVDPADRRRRVISLTETGQSAANDLAKSATDIETDFLHGLAPADRAELNRLLRTLHASLTP